VLLASRRAADNGWVMLCCAPTEDRAAALDDALAALDGEARHSCAVWLLYTTDAGVLTDGLGVHFEVTRTDIKKWAVGTPIQGPLDAIESIRTEHPFETDQVKNVVVRLAPSVAAVVGNRDMPDICLQHMVAVILLDKTASFSAAHDKARMKDAAVLRQRAKVQLVKDEKRIPLLPARVAEVEIALTDGTTLTERVTSVRGTPRNPMTRKEVIDKSRDLIDPVLGAATAARLVETVFALDRLSNVRSLRSLLQHAAAERPREAPRA